MPLKVEINTQKELAPSYNNSNYKEKIWANFHKIISDPNIGFFHINRRQELIDSCLKVFTRFQDKTHFVQVGIGGSSLGPEMLISALNQSERSFTFINNIDPEEIDRQLKSIEKSTKNTQDVLFYFVSKSGGTAEMSAAFAIITAWLRGKGIQSEHLKDYFVFATDPKKSDLLSIADELNCECLEVPSNVGGRFSVLTPVGLLSAFFAEIDCQLLMNGAEDVKGLLLDEDLDQNSLFQVAAQIMTLKEEGANQTVLMPYSSRLRDLSFWFVQLWAESLGKKHCLKGEKVHTGFTPVPAYGATDQHSQVQLFMEGPYDKVLLLLEVENFHTDFSLKNDYQTPSLKKLGQYSLSQLMKAELEGTKKALSSEKRPFIVLKLERNDAYHLGQVILFLEALTAMTGTMLGINTFDQPGVEAGKKYAFEYLEKIQQ